ncbi:MAG: phospho-N-acetylmuramoyl-pentapeptide-transferase [Ruminococcaceae bacterium]|nr:phospho-N-acetylmuramoyl-pentapeptide-transferase [Oscillospiraceae bacterium]
MEIWILVGTLLLTLIVTFLLEKKFIPYLMRIKMGQTILEIGPRWHKSKEGTPTMGGLFFAGGILVSVLAFGIPLLIREGDMNLLKVFVMTVLYGAVGFIDDFVKFVKKRNKGLSAIQKLIFQFAIAAGFFYSMKDSLTTKLDLPFTDLSLDLGAFYWVFAMVFLVLVVNAVNLTDGIDGLAGSTTLVVFAFFAAVAWRIESAESLLFSSAICGGMIGFLIYNIYPARIFMGDTGSLFLGGAVAGMAFWLNNPLIIVFVGFVYLFEALSVVLQVGSYKMTKKRIFRMAPFHHHLEMCGWKEPRIVSFSCILTAVLCVLAYFGFYF